MEEKKLEVVEEKKEFVSPEIEIILFTSEDVITTSGGGGYGDNPTPPIKF